MCVWMWRRLVTETFCLGFCRTLLYWGPFHGLSGHQVWCLRGRGHPGFISWQYKDCISTFLDTWDELSYDKQEFICLWYLWSLITAAMRIKAWPKAASAAVSGFIRECGVNICLRALHCHWFLVTFMSSSARGSCEELCLHWCTPDGQQEENCCRC